MLKSNPTNAKHAGVSVKKTEMRKRLELVAFRDAIVRRCRIFRAEKPRCLNTRKQEETMYSEIREYVERRGGIEILGEYEKNALIEMVKSRRKMPKSKVLKPHPQGGSRGMKITYGRCHKAHGSVVKLDGIAVGVISRVWGMEDVREDLWWVYIPYDCDDHRLNSEISLPHMWQVKKDLDWQAKMIVRT